MGDHFVLLVDRMLTESSLEAAVKSRISSKEALSSTTDNTDCFPCKDSELGPREVVECRICQDEDVDLNMEVPCSCSGSLKYAHRKCIQRWCNEKGDTMCEICHHQFKPGYTAPPPIFRLGRLPVNLRGNWRIGRGDTYNPHIIAMVSTNQRLLDPDESAASTLRSIVCCRFVAITLMIILIMRHTLPVIVNQSGSQSFILLMLVMLRITGIVLPICIILKAVTSALVSRGRQPASVSSFASDEETSTRLALNQTHVIAIQ